MIIIMEQAIAQWWERSPPTNVARVQILASTPYVGWVCCWFSPLLREVFLQVPRRDPSPQKPTFSKFQFDQESGRRRTTLWMCYLQIIIIIFIIIIIIIIIIIMIGQLKLSQSHSGTFTWSSDT